MRINRALPAALLSSLDMSGLKIMPLGDSITEITCWRTKVWDMFVDADIAKQVNFVGSMSDNPGKCESSKDSKWDMDHEGHAGDLAIDIANNDLPGWLDEAKPDVVQFMLGTNDVVEGHSTDAILDAYTKMVGQMRDSNSKMKIIVDTILPQIDADEKSVRDLNEAIPGWAESHNSTDSPIYVADVYGHPFPKSALRSDGIHPNDDGDTIIAEVVGPILIDIAKASIGHHKHSN